MRPVMTNKRDPASLVPGATLRGIKRSAGLGSVQSPCHGGRPTAGRWRRREPAECSTTPILESAFALPWFLGGRRRAGTEERFGWALALVFTVPLGSLGKIPTGAPECERDIGEAGSGPRVSASSRSRSTR